MIMVRSEVTENRGNTLTWLNKRQSVHHVNARVGLFIAMLITHVMMMVMTGTGLSYNLQTKTQQPNISILYQSPRHLLLYFWNMFGSLKVVTTLSPMSPVILMLPTELENIRRRTKCIAGIVKKLFLSVMNWWTDIFQLKIVRLTIMSILILITQRHSAPLTNKFRNND